MNEFDPTWAFRVVDVTGVLANGLLGGAVARTHRFDAVGFVVLAIASGLGGGMLRDVLLNRLPVALTDPWYLGGALVSAAVAYLLTLEGRPARRLLAVADVLALGCWSATGASKALGIGLGWMPAVMLGVITAVGGGVIRDILVNRVPAIFGGSPLYATVAVVGSVEMVLLQGAGHPEAGMALSIVTCAALGLVARRRRWMLPGPGVFSLPRPRWRPRRHPGPRRPRDRHDGAW